MFYNYLIIGGLLLILSINLAIAQNTLSDIQSFITNVNATVAPLAAGSKVADWSGNNLLTPATLNRYIAKQTVQYLSGKTDLTYYNTYFTANSSDGSLAFGRSNTGKDKSTERIKYVMNYGLKTKLLSGLGNLFSGGKFNREVGIYYNFTKFGLGHISYQNGDADKMKAERDYIYKTIELDFGREMLEFNNSQGLALASYDASSPSASDRAIFVASQQNALAEFKTTKDKEYKERFFDLEEKAAKKFIRFVRTHWWTPRFSVSGTTYSVSPEATQIPTDQFFFPLSGGLSYSFYREDLRPKSWRRLRSLVTFSGDLLNTNQLQLLDQYGKDAASKLGGMTINKDNSSTYWQGPYNIWWKVNLQGRALLTLPYISKVVSLDLLYSFTTGRYETQDASIGLLFNLPGQDPKSPVNVELLGRFKDLYGNLLPGQNAFDRLQVGISLALPFNSKLNSL